MNTTIKTVPPLTALTVSRRLKLADIPEFAGTAVGPLCEKAGQMGLQFVGDLVFLYEFHGEDIDCTIAQPVAEAKGDPTPYKFVTTESFRCLSTLYVGGMPGIGKAWDELMHAANAQGLKNTPFCREVYVKWVDFESPQDETELQAGIQ